MGLRETPLGVMVKGGLAGLVGALVERVVTRRFAAPPPPGLEDPREALVRKIATGILETEMAEGERQSWAEAVHWMYGAAWGEMYGKVQQSLHLPWPAHGLALGTAVWAAGPLFLLPVAGLAPSLRGTPPRQTAARLGAHLAYGLTTALVYALLSTGERESRA